MNAYVASVIENVKKKHGNEPEFVQTVEEVFSSISPVMDKHPEYEKADLLKNASERVLTGLLPVLDDFERGLAACSANEADEAIYKGMELIYNKFVKYLESNGVKAMDTNGADFNADFHEAIATVPAPDQKGKIIDTTLKGYTINDKVLRHAKVVVGE